MSKADVELEQGIAPILFGNLDHNIKLVEELTGVRVKTSANGLQIEGNSIEHAVQLINALQDMAISGIEIDSLRIQHAHKLVQSGRLDSIAKSTSSVVVVNAKGSRIRAKTVGQQEYVDAIRNNTVTFGEGPAGSGKTYLAVALAVATIKKKEVSRLILTRPAIEAGEKLGFLPGDIQQKVDPYLRPLYDALEDIVGEGSYLDWIEKGKLEIAPLAYMRGRTLHNAFIILDEAQNTTNEQMKMFLTRFGQGSKVVVVGDMTQIDLPRGQASGLNVALMLLQGIEDIASVYLQSSDIVRHPLVGKIVDAYSRERK